MESLTPIHRFTYKSMGKEGKMLRIGNWPKTIVILFLLITSSVVTFLRYGVTSRQKKCILNLFLIRAPKL